MSVNTVADKARYRPSNMGVYDVGGNFRGDQWPYTVSSV